MTFLHRTADDDATIRCAVSKRLAKLRNVNWDQMRRPTGLYQLRQWWAAVEELGPRKVQYVYAQDMSRRVLGIVPIHLVPAGRSARFYAPSSTLGPSISQKLSDGTEGLVILGGRVGYMTGWSLAADDVGVSKPLAHLLTLANQLAQDTGLGIFSIQYLPASEAKLLVHTGLVDAENLVLQDFGTRIKLPGRCFDDYLASLKPSRRHTIRRDLDRFARSGLTLQTTKLSESLTYAPHLLTNVQQFHNAGGCLPQYRRLLKTHAKWLDKYGVVVTSRSPKGEPISFSQSYIVDDNLHVRMAGIDYGSSGETGAYFSTSYYGPIRLAYERGISNVEMGIGALTPKVLRGALLEPLYGFFAGRDFKVLSLADRERVQRAVYQRVERDTGGMVQLPAFDTINADVLAE